MAWSDIAKLAPLAKPNKVPFVVAWSLLLFGAVIFVAADESDHLALAISGVFLWLGILGTGLGIVLQSRRFSTVTRIIGWLLLCICAAPMLILVRHT